MANNTLKRITTRAKQIKKAHPKMKYVQAQRQAAKELKRGKKIGAVKKTAKRKAPVASKIRKRVGSVSKVKQLENQLGKEYVKFYNETTVRGTELSRKKLAEIKKALRAAKRK